MEQALEEYRSAMGVRIRRAYEDPGPRDGFRVLVDRVWPRGKSKDALAVDEWMKELAPSAELRKWFGHDPDRFEGFRARYLEELAEDPARSLLAELVERASRQTVTLVYGAKDEEHNQAVVLAETIEGRLRAS